MRVPKYRKHTNGIGFVEWKRKRYYFPGPYKSVESSEAYREFLSLNVFGPGGHPSAPVPQGEGLSLAGLIVRFLAHAKTYYPAGNRSEYANCRNALKPLAAAHGRVLAASFGPLKLEAWQTHLANTENSRGYINQQVGIVKRMFRWAARNELLPVTIYQALATVPGLKANRSAAREPAKRQPVARKHIKPVLAQLRPTTRAMVLFQVFTGARSGSICKATPAQFTKDGDLLLWRPRHKTEHLDGPELVIPIGPQCQAVLAPYLQKPPDAPLFSPQTARRNRRYRRAYRPMAYANAIRRAIERVNRSRKPKDKIPHWSPHQLRHSKGHEIGDLYGLEAVQAMLGQKGIEAAKIYSGRRLKLAKKIARKTG